MNDECWLVQISPSYWLWYGDSTPPICAKTGNYVWRKSWWRIYRMCDFTRED